MKEAIGSGVSVVLTTPTADHHDNYNTQSVPYALLFEELGLGEGKVRELEDLVIETIYMVRGCVGV